MPVDRSRLPDVGPDPSFAFPSIVHHRLANGLRVRAVEHHSVPIITLALQLEGGSGGDTPGSEGLAALVADMVDEGTGSLTAIDVSDALARIGLPWDAYRALLAILARPRLKRVFCLLLGGFFRLGYFARHGRPPAG